jgi:hypothetical protein
VEQVVRDGCAQRAHHDPTDRDSTDRDSTDRDSTDRDSTDRDSTDRDSTDRDEALTTSCRPAASANNAMISSGALPKSNWTESADKRQRTSGGGVCQEVAFSALSRRRGRPPFRPSAGRTVDVSDPLVGTTGISPV